MMALAILVGIVSAVVGLYVSLWADAASGATIVLVETALFVAAMTLGPRTGLLAKLHRVI
jgi:ABC-type Mn2+/Zn2+ transport system permease subunit